MKLSVINLRSNVAKNALIFLGEITSTKKQAEPVQEFVKQVMPTVMAKTVYEKAFIANLAKKAI